MKFSFFVKQFSHLGGKWKIEKQTYYENKEQAKAEFMLLVVKKISSSTYATKITYGLVSKRQIIYSTYQNH